MVSFVSVFYHYLLSGPEEESKSLSVSLDSGISKLEQPCAGGQQDLLTELERNSEEWTVSLGETEVATGLRV